MASPPLQPTYQGLVGNTYDALMLFEACLSGRLNHVPRRPHDRERTGLICSGNIFIYEEHSSGIKRWTDGISWSPSRILGNFLVYRELCQSFGPGEKKRALKKPVSKRPSTGGITKTTTTPTSASTTTGSQPTAFPPQRLSLSATSSFDDSTHPNGTNGANGDAAKDPLRDLVGSLTESYDFKEGGLVKKTISIRHQGISHHLVSYYSIEDALNGKLRLPSQDPEFHNLNIREELLFAQTFRAAISEYEYAQNGAYLTTGGYLAVPHHVDGTGIIQHPAIQGFHPGHPLPPGQPFHQGAEFHAAPGFPPGPGFQSGPGPGPGPSFHPGFDDSFANSTDLQGFGLQSPHNAALAPIDYAPQPPHPAHPPQTSSQQQPQPGGPDNDFVWP